MARNRTSRAVREAPPALTQVLIPNKVYFRIGEVSELTQTKPYVLRFWETEFPTLKPTKTNSGHRLYRRRDVETVFQIKRLLYEQGFTIEGARKQLAGDAKGQPEQKGLFSTGGGTVHGGELRTIKRELQTILAMLSKSR